jgi:hypothetical protein
LDIVGSSGPIQKTRRKGKTLDDAVDELGCVGFVPLNKIPTQTKPLCHVNSWSTLSYSITFQARELLSFPNLCALLCPLNENTLIRLHCTRGIEVFN